MLNSKTECFFFLVLLLTLLLPNQTWLSTVFAKRSTTTRASTDSQNANHKQSVFFGYLSLAQSSSTRALRSVQVFHALEAVLVSKSQREPIFDFSFVFQLFYFLASPSFAQTISSLFFVLLSFSFLMILHILFFTPILLCSPRATD
jgi:hypothetical protein